MLNPSGNIGDCGSVVLVLSGYEEWVGGEGRETILWKSSDREHLKTDISREILEYEKTAI